MEERIFLSPPHMSGNEQKYINDAFETNWIAPLGPNVEGFEKELANYVNVKAAAATSSGTAAIHLALDLLGVGRGDTVFCSSLTFIASANPIIYLGAEPVFVDSERETWNMSPEALENAFIDAKKNGKLPKAVIVVNLYGQSANLDPIIELCTQYNVPIIEDAAESLGASYKGKASGSFGKFGIYSFNGNKIITTSGGGMLVSDDEDLIVKARILATQARDKARHYQHSKLGYNYRMSNILAGVGRAQLAVLDERVNKRREIFNKYKQAIGNCAGVTFMPEPDYCYSTRWLTTLTLDPNDSKATTEQILLKMEEGNIEARPVWKPLHAQPIFEGAKYYQHPKDVSVSDELFKNGICLPSGSSLTESQQDRVINILLDILK
jgi:pyridoxal phosphate-dependent aminotransferase EpsN